MGRTQCMIQRYQSKLKQSEPNFGCSVWIGNVIFFTNKNLHLYLGLLVLAKWILIFTLLIFSGCYLCLGCRSIPRVWINLELIPPWQKYRTGWSSRTSRNWTGRSVWIVSTRLCPAGCRLAKSVICLGSPLKKQPSIDVRTSYWAHDTLFKHGKYHCSCSQADGTVW